MSMPHLFSISGHRVVAFVASALVVGSAAAAHAQTTTKVGTDSCDYVDGSTMVRLTLPEKLAPGGFVRGLLLEGNGGTGDNRAIAQNVLRRNFAGRFGFATAGTGGLDGTQTFGSKGAVILRGIELCGAMLGHPEVKDAPFIAQGASSGGAFAYGVSMLAPKRAIAFGVNVPAGLNPSNPTDEMIAIPGMFAAGQLDTIVGALPAKVEPLMTRARPRGALWSKNEMEGVGHADGHVFDMWIPFFEKAIAKRLPADADPRKGPVTLMPIAESSGFLVDDSTWSSGFTKFSSYADFSGDKRGANTSWVIDEDMARQQRAFTSRPRVVDLGVAGRSDAAIYGFVTRQKVGTTIEFSGVATKYPNWSTITLFRGAKMIASLTGGGASFKFSVPIAADDPLGLAFHAVADGPMGMKVTQPWTVLKLPGDDVAMPPGVDAGAPPAGGQDAGAPAGGAGGSGGGAGAGGATGGTGGQNTMKPVGGAGGQASAGSSGTSGGSGGDRAPESSSGGGCSFGGPRTGGAAALFLLVAVALRRRRRR